MQARSAVQAMCPWLQLRGAAPAANNVATAAAPGLPEASDGSLTLAAGLQQRNGGQHSLLRVQLRSPRGRG